MDEPGLKKVRREALYFHEDEKEARARTRRGVGVKFQGGFKGGWIDAHATLFTLTMCLLSSSRVFFFLFFSNPSLIGMIKHAARICL